MPDIGMVELILIGLVGFLVLGPERLPVFLGQIGKFMRQGRAWMTSLKMQLDQERQHISQPVQEIKEEVETSIKDVVNDVTGEKK